MTNNIYIRPANTKRVLKITQENDQIITRRITQFQNLQNVLTTHQRPPNTHSSDGPEQCTAAEDIIQTNSQLVASRNINLHLHDLSPRAHTHFPPRDFNSIQRCSHQIYLQPPNTFSRRTRRGYRRQLEATATHQCLRAISPDFKQKILATNVRSPSTFTGRRFH